MECWIPAASYNIEENLILSICFTTKDLKADNCKMSFTTILALLSLSTLLPTPTASQATLPPRVINPSEQPCPSDAVRETIQSQINQDIRALLQENVICPAVRTQTCPAAQTQTCSAAQTQTSPADSCSAISTNCPSGKGAPLGVQCKSIVTWTGCVTVTWTECEVRICSDELLTEDCSVVLV